MLTAEVNAIENGDYSFINFGSGVEIYGNDAIIDNRYEVRDAVGAAMEETLAEDALGRIANKFADGDGNVDLDGFIDRVIEQYEKDGHLGVYRQFFSDGGARVYIHYNPQRLE